MNSQERTIVFHNVSLIDGSGAPIQTGKTVTLMGNRISAIENSTANLPSGADVIDGTRKFMIPGLWDMHVHVINESVLDIAFPLLLANGITCVRDMNGPMPLTDIKILKDKIAKGEIVGPRFVAPGPLIDGPARSAGARGPNTIVVEDEDSARAAVRRLKAEGADFVEIYHALPRELLLAILDEARKQNIPAAGHVPFFVSAPDASDAGQASMEHLTPGVTSACSTKDAELIEMTRKMHDEGVFTQQPPPMAKIIQLFTARKNVVPAYDDKITADLFNRFRENATWQCPALISNRGQALAELEIRFKEDPRLKYLPRPGPPHGFNRTAAYKSIRKKNGAPCTSFKSESLVKCTEQGLG